MYKISERVEVGVFSKKNHCEGGTFYIDFEIKKFEKGIIEKISKIIDRFDHTLITDNKDMENMSHRHIIINECSNLFDDIARILKTMILMENIDIVENIIIRNGKVSYYDSFADIGLIQIQKINYEG